MFVRSGRPNKEMKGKERKKVGANTASFSAGDIIPSLDDSSPKNDIEIGDRSARTEIER